MAWEDMEKKENEKVDKLLKEDNIILDKKISEQLPKVVMPVNATGDKVYALMDSEDEKMIVKAELLDETVKTLVYKPLQGEATLTIVGIFEAARRFKNIKMGIKNVMKTDDSYIAYAYAHNLKDNLYIELAVEQPIRTKFGESMVKDPFAFQKAQSKAIRNCVKKVIPVNFFQAVIKTYMEQSKTKGGIVARK